MHNKLSRLALAGLLWCGATAAATSLPETVVTASRIDEPAQSSVRTVTVVTRKQVERAGAHDVAQILNRLPGIQIGRNGGPGQATSLFMRGTASDQVLILIDGVPAQSATTGAAALQHIDPALIERIEVVRGPASTLYGSSAMGGVIQIFTRKGHAGAPHLDASLRAGNEGTLEIATGLSGGRGPFSGGFSLSHQQSDGYPPKSTSRLSRSYRHDSFNLRMDYAIDPDLQLELAHWQSQGNVQYLDFFNAPKDQDVRNSITHLALDMSHGDNWSSRLQLGRVVDNSDENQSTDFAHTTRLALDWQHTWTPSDTQTLIGGITLAQERANLASFGTRYDRSTHTRALYLQDEYQSGGLALQAGVRGLHHSHYGNRATWNLGAGYQLATQTHLHANAGTAFRSPSANDLYGFGGNPNFKPEKSRSFEIGLRQGLGKGQSASLNLFHTRVRDLIESDPTTFVIQQVERARIRGVELGYDLNHGPWTLGLDYTWQDAENLDQHNSLARRAENKLDLKLGYDQGPWWGQAALTAETDRRDSRFNNRVLGAYTVVDLATGYHLDRDWQIEANVKNLFNERYELAGGYPAQDRLLTLGLRYRPR